MADTILDIRGLEVSYGNIQALRGVDLHVEEGEIITLIGANGAGKSTLMNTIMGLVRRKGGTITYNGTDISGMDTREIVKKGIILAPEGRQIFPDLSVLDNLLMGGYLQSDAVNEETIKTVFELFPILGERKNQMGLTLSGGEQQMLAVGRAMMAKPRVLLLDEPSLGLAPIIVSSLFKLIGQIRDMGVTILLVEQNARIALRTADRAYVLESGRIVASDRSEVLLQSDLIEKSYLGRG